MTHGNAKPCMTCGHGKSFHSERVGKRNDGRVCYTNCECRAYIGGDLMAEDDPIAGWLAEWRREMHDKLGVVFDGCNGTPLRRSTSRQQCEDFLVEYVEARLVEVQRRHQEERVHLENQIEGLKLDWATEHLARMQAEAALAALQTPQEETDK